MANELGLAIIAELNAAAVAGAAVTKNLATDTVLGAAGNSQGTAAAIDTEFTPVSGADGTKGVILPTFTLGARYFIYNTDASNNLKVYPPTSGTISGGSANAAFLIPPKSTVAFTANQAVDWSVGIGLGALRSGAAQAAVATTGAGLTSYGYTEAQANGIVTLLNELQAWAVTTGTFKGSA